LSDKMCRNLALGFKKAPYPICGQSTHKQEFVTCGGVDLKEIDFRSFQSKLHPGLFFAGELLDIDAITGGFNFQNAWTGGWHIATFIDEATKSLS
jgi:predicted flavoprotein YhiN